MLEHPFKSDQFRNDLKTLEMQLKPPLPAHVRKESLMWGYRDMHQVEPRQTFPELRPEAWPLEHKTGVLKAIEG